MSVCQQAIRRRRQAKLDRRYRVRSALTSAEKLRQQVEAEALRRSRKALSAKITKA